MNQNEILPAIPIEEDSSLKIDINERSRLKKLELEERKFHLERQNEYAKKNEVRKIQQLDIAFCKICNAVDEQLQLSDEVEVEMSSVITSVVSFALVERKVRDHYFNYKVFIKHNKDGGWFGWPTFKIKLLKK
jgi:hypothetical protein